MGKKNASNKQKTTALHTPITEQIQHPGLKILARIIARNILVKANKAKEKGEEVSGL